MMRVEEQELHEVKKGEVEMAKKPQPPNFIVLFHARRVPEGFANLYRFLPSLVKQL